MQLSKAPHFGFDLRSCQTLWETVFFQRQVTFELFQLKNTSLYENLSRGNPAATDLMKLFIIALGTYIEQRQYSQHFKYVTRRKAQGRKTILHVRFKL